MQLNFWSGPKSLDCGPKHFGTCNTCILVLDCSRFCRRIVTLFEYRFSSSKILILVHSATVHCTHHAAPFHSGIPRIKLSFYYSSTIILYIFKIYRAHLLKLHWRAQVFIFSIFDENNFEQIPHRVNVANVFFTCMRFLRIAYPNLFLEMCVHGGMLAHFSTLKCFFSTTLKAMLLYIYLLFTTLKYLINEYTRLTIAMLSPTFEKS